MTQKKAAAVLQLTQRVKADGEKETESEVVGRSIVDPSINAGLMQERFTNHIGQGSGLMATIQEVQRITNAVKAGDMSDLEAMLVGQAIALQTISSNLAARAQEQSAQRNLEAFLGLALKAQAQSRSTIQALVELKYPRQVVYAKNVGNVNNGQQQINTGLALAQAGKTEPPQNKLLESSNGEWMDTRTAGKAGRVDPVLAAVGQVNRAAKRRRKGQGVA
ncbi:hypothetical protein J2739_002746 [Variovorax soli]|uniref:Uncharacterized protein n=2 Tax=Variovorax soli TaxID=376815 RepID=A0ABU1NET9_9BURK|nr:hypothetical protein [Variovorax soli]